MSNSNFYYYIIITVFCSILTVFYFLSFNGSLVQYVRRVEEKVLGTRLNASFPIIFYHNAYVDYRYSPPRLRIFSLNKCIKKKKFIEVDLFYENDSVPIRINIYGESLEEFCPTNYGPAKPCFYVPHTFIVNLKTAGSISNIVIHLGNREVKLGIKEIQKPYEEGITMCLQPVYYYTQWQNIILYIEAWRAQGATRFIVFYHSSTKETRKVLNHYQKLGIIELRSWPSFGNLPSGIADKYPKPDDSSFIFAYFLAMNICILDIKTTIGSIADFDEIMVPKNGTMLEYATKEMKNTNIGAISFGNNYVSMEPSIYSSNFSGVSNLTFYDRGGPSKYVFNTSVIEVCQVHWVQSFIDKNKKTKNSDGALLHLRFNVKKFNAKKVQKPYHFFPGNASNHIKNMQETTKSIFGETPPNVSMDLIAVLNKCIDRITKKGETCRSTGGMCKADMDEVYEWVYDQTEGVFVS